MSANRKLRRPLTLVVVLLVAALLSGVAPMNHASPVVLAPFSDDVFPPSSAFEHTNLAVAPTANFSADPTSGLPPLQVQFTDQSAGNPTGWAWYFGDETFGEPWTQMTTAIEWPARYNHSSVALPDGSIILMGGYGYTYLNDVWRSTDQGATWTQMTAAAEWTARQDHTSVALPDGSIVLMGGWDGSNYLNDVWRSTDQGATWTPMTPAAQWAARCEHSSDTLPDGSIVLMGGIGRETVGVIYSDVWRSTDQGATWIKMVGNAPWGSKYEHASVALPDGSIVLMGGRVENDVWRSTDQGATWTEMTAAASWAGRNDHTSVALPDGSIVLMGGNCVVGSALRAVNDVWRSTDQGATWTQMASAAEWRPRYGHTSVVLPDGRIVLMGGSSGIGYRNDVWRSTDQGETWTPQPYTWSTRRRHTSVALPDGSIVLMGGYDGSNRLNDVWRSIDQGATWTQMTAAAEWTARSDHTSVALPDGSIVLMGGYDGSRRNDVWRSTDQGATWTQMTSIAEWTARSEHSSATLPDGSIVLMGGYGASGPPKNDVWRSIDQGATWTQMTVAAGWMGRVDHSSVALPDGSIILMGGYGFDLVFTYLNDVWRSTDQGATWTQMTAAAGWTTRYGHSSVALPDGSIVLMGGYDGSNRLHDIWRSTDRGVTWTQTAAAEWAARENPTSVALPDGSIVLMGGWEVSIGYLNDVWRLETAGSSEQHPTHIYTGLGTYSVALQVYNTAGYSSLRRAAYIQVADTENHFIYLPLVLRNTP
jgi:N-acetylneuraminic acid mutarotase